MDDHVWEPGRLGLGPPTKEGLKFAKGSGFLPATAQLPQTPEDAVQWFCALMGETHNHLTGFETPCDCFCQPWRGIPWRTSPETFDFIKHAVSQALLAVPRHG